MKDPVSIRCRLIGVLEAEQSDDRQTQRNDRLLAIAEECLDHKDVRSIKDLNDHLLEEIEHFFVSYHELDGNSSSPRSAMDRTGPSNWSAGE